MSTSESLITVAHLLRIYNSLLRFDIERKFWFGGFVAMLHDRHPV